MTPKVASFLLRLYPTTWRMRYEEEVRALLEDNPPGLRDLAGLGRGALAEWSHTVIDPVGHPVLAGIITGIGGWLGAILLIAVSSKTAGLLLERAFGVASDWVGFYGGMAVFVVFFRALLAQPFLLDAIPIRRDWTLRLGPLTAAQARRWWTLLWAAAVCGVWAHAEPPGWIPPIWSNAVLFLRLAGEAGWQRHKAMNDLRLLRRELSYAMSDLSRLVKLQKQGLATIDEVDGATAEVTRLTGAIKEAGRMFDAARLRHLPPQRPLGLH